MPISKKRKKKGKPVKRGSDRMTGLTLQDLINVAAYQQYKDEGLYDDAEKGVELSDFPTVLDIEDPTAEAVIQAVVDARDGKESKDDG